MVAAMDGFSSGFGAVATAGIAVSGEALPSSAVNCVGLSSSEMGAGASSACGAGGAGGAGGACACTAGAGADSSVGACSACFGAAAFLK